MYVIPHIYTCMKIQNVCSADFESLVFFGAERTECAQQPKQLILAQTRNPAITQICSFRAIAINDPGSPCVNERSFSTLRRLNTYLRSTMVPKRLNHIGIWHIYAEMIDSLGINLLINEFIVKNLIRTAITRFLVNLF